MTFMTQLVRLLLSLMLCWPHGFVPSWVAGSFPLCISVRSGWIRDLLKLTSLHLRKMPRLRILEAAVFKMTPNLQQLDCQDSSALTSVHTQLFQDTPRLQVLLFQK